MCGSKPLSSSKRELLHCVHLTIHVLTSLVSQILPSACLPPWDTWSLAKYVHINSVKPVILTRYFSDSKSIYVLLLVYAASTATTTLPCLMAVWNTPFSSSETRAAKVPSVTPAQRRMLLAAYLPFFLIPLLMTVDMSFRVLKLVRAGTRAQLEAKTK